jgi:diacylglycerol kinase family enzyme
MEVRPVAPAKTTAGMAAACVILNPGSGKKKDAGVRDRIEQALARHPGCFTLRVVPKGGSIAEEAEAAARDGFDVLVAAGGDGTICAVAEVAHRHDLRLGVLPLGTFNYVARGLDLPEEVEDAVDVIAAGAARDVPVAEVNGRMFLNNASLGLYPAILQQREGTYRRWGRSRLAAHWSVLVMFMRFHRPLSLKVVVDGQQIRARTPLAFVARSAYQLELFGLDGAEAVRDGRFAVFLAPDGTRWQLLLFAVRLAWRSMERGRDFELFDGRDVDIEKSRGGSRRVARDGERERLRSPFRFRIHERALRVVAPEAGGA